MVKVTLLLQVTLKRCVTRVHHPASSTDHDRPLQDRVRRLGAAVCALRGPGARRLLLLNAQPPGPVHVQFLRRLQGILHKE